LLLAATSIVFSAIYSIWLVGRISFGTLSTSFIKRYEDLSRQELVLLFYLCFYIFFLGLSGNFVIELISSNVKEILITAELNTTA
jgi:NADH-quinone oxidoreductase subunit M